MGLQIAIFIFAVLCVLLNGFFVAAEFAIVRLRVTRLQELKDRGNRLAAMGLENVLQRLPRGTAIRLLLSCYNSKCLQGTGSDQRQRGQIGWPERQHPIVLEKYRALLTEIHDQLIDLPVIAQRRDALMKEASELFVQAPPADRATYEIARKALGAVYSDQQLDQFLPLPLRRAGGATT